MSYNSLSDFILKLEKHDELIRIKEFVDPVLEIAEITDRISKQAKGGKALLFENTGTKFPVLINSLGSLKRISLALGVDQLDYITDEMDSFFKKLSTPRYSFIDKLKLLPELKHVSSWIPKLSNRKGSCQQVINLQPDISLLPVLKCWPNDGGKFITLPIVNTKDPVTGIRNVGMYRMQIFTNTITGMHWHRHKVGARHFNEYKKLGRRMPIAVVLGGDPVYTYSATAPLPDNFDEYLFAGFIRKKNVELVKCITQNIEVPTDVDIVIEGYVDPNDELILEGPFGDHTGFYSLPDYYPKFHITCITHKTDAVYPATIVGIPPQEDAYVAKATERIFVFPIKVSILPEVIDMDIPKEGVAHNLTIIKINKDYPGQGKKVMNSLWGAGQMMFNKILIVTNEDTDIHDYITLASKIFQHFEPGRDLLFSNGPLDVLDHAANNFTFGGKLGIDATEKYIEELASNNLSSVSNFVQNNFDQGEIPQNILDCNLDLIKMGIPVVFVSLKSKEQKPDSNLAYKLLKNTNFINVKILFFLDPQVDIQDLRMCIWIATNNIDAQRDLYIIRKDFDSSKTVLIVDGTNKINLFLKRGQNWPNVIVSDDYTIKRIDEKWENLNLGEFIQSPSLKYKKLLFGEGAIATLQP